MQKKSNNIGRNTAIFLIASSVYFSPIIGDFAIQVSKEGNSKLADFLFEDSEDEIEQIVEETRVLRILRAIREKHYYYENQKRNLDSY
jgi:hypothetical protein